MQNSKMHIADPHCKWRIERNEVKMGKLFSFDFDDGKYALRRSRAQSSKFITSAKSNKSATSSAQHHPHVVYRGENKDRNLITVNVDCTLVVRIIIVPTVACECEVPRQMLTLYQSRALNAEYKTHGVQQLFTAASV